MDRNRLKFILSSWLIIIGVINFGFENSFGMAEKKDTTRIQSGNQIDALRIFIDCENCDFNYIRNNIKFVNFVREPHLAHIHILISEQKTASEGRKFSLRFLGRQNYAGMDQNLVYTSPLTDTEDKLRRGLIQILKMGLMPYISQTSMANMLDIKYNENEVNAARKQDDDGWKYWVFHIDLEGEFQAEESQNELDVASSISAERITEIWKIKSELIYEHQQESFKDNDEKITGKRKEWEAEAEIIKSLNSHWSVGLFGRYNFSTYKNINLSLGLAPGIEYNFFPWSQSDRRIFSISYSAGVRSFQYDEVSLFNKTKETLSYGRLRIELGLIQPWGDVDASLENSHYFHDLSKNLLNLETDLSFRIAKGLAFKLEVKAESIHDQLYLPKGDATLEEILLKQKKLATTYEVSVLFGLRYSFGSIYNNIVNRRF
jgi:hypothetical protein